MFSFHASKVLTSAEGGAVACNSSDFFKKITRFRFYGLQEGDVFTPGINGKMSELNAALGLCNLRYIDSIIDRRRILFEQYKHNLENCNGISFRAEKLNVQYNYIYCYILIDQANYGHNGPELIQYLNNKNIRAKRCFSKLISEMEYYSLSRRNDLSKAKAMIENIVVLPLHCDMSENDVDYICEMIIEFSATIKR